jgi:DNA-binding IscR family transcriptional regulator
MRIRRETELALAALAALGRSAGPVPSNDLLPGLSQQDRSAAMRPLQNKKLVRKTPAREYELAKSAASITLADVIEAAQGPITLDRRRVPVMRRIEPLLKQVDAAIKQSLKGITLAAIIEKLPQEAQTR